MGGDQGSAGFSRRRGRIPLSSRGVALLLALALLCSTSLAASSTVSRFNFASLQEHRDLAVAPGGSVSTRILLFAPYGEAQLHVRLSVGESPPGWSVSISPDLHRERYTLGAGVAEVEENILVDPRKGDETISFPGLAAPVPSRPVTVTLRPPSGAAPGSYRLRVDSVATNLNDDGNITVSQARSFLYTITVTSAPPSLRAVNETLSATLEGFPLEFGVIFPGRAGPSQEGRGFPATVRVDPITSVPVHLTLRGSDFRYRGKGFPVSNLEVGNGSASPRRSVEPVFPAEDLFPEWASIPVPQGTPREIPIYFWLTIPKGQPPGAYTNFITIGVNPQGVSPGPPPEVSVRIEAAPTPTPTPAAPPAAPATPRPTPRQPGFEGMLAVVALLAMVVLVSRRRAR